MKVDAEAMSGSDFRFTCPLPHECSSVTIVITDEGITFDLYENVDSNNRSSRARLDYTFAELASFLRGYCLRSERRGG